MAWTERQQAMLQAMGLRVWTRAHPEPEPQADTPPPAAPTAPAVVAGAVAGDVPPAVAATRAAAAAAVSPVAAPAVATRDLGAVATLDWTGLRQTVAECRACELCGSRTQTVFGVGDTQAHWMIVGEAPGENEDLQGEPFVGAAGQLLDRMLAALQLTRSAEGPQGASQRVYIANTLKCRPPRNRNPTPEELAQCEPFLIRQIELLRPRIILAMGRFAVQTLLRSTEPVGKLRGRVHRYQGVPLVVTYHPAYLLRSPAEKSRSWEDLCLAAATVEAAGSPDR